MPGCNLDSFLEHPPTHKHIRNTYTTSSTARQHMRPSYSANCVKRCMPTVRRHAQDMHNANANPAVRESDDHKKTSLQNNNRERNKRAHKQCPLFGCNPAAQTAHGAVSYLPSSSQCLPFLAVALIQKMREQNHKLVKSTKGTRS